MLKPNDVARRLAVSRSSVYDAASAGQIPFARIGGQNGPLCFVPEDIGRVSTRLVEANPTVPFVSVSEEARDDVQS